MKQSDNKSDSHILRQQAEERLKQKLQQSGLPHSESDILKLNHELEVHQIELEMINQDILLTKEQAESSANRYSKLYDFAPSGYVTLNRDGKICELNRKAAQILGKERSLLANRLFSHFVSKDTKSAFLLFLKKVFNSSANESCEVAFNATNNQQKFVYLTGQIDENEEQCLVAMVDITVQEHASEALRASEEKYRTGFMLQHSILESPVDIIIFALDKNFCYTAFTRFHKKTIKKIWGVDIQPGMNMLDIITNPDDRQKAKANFDRALQGEYFMLTEEYGNVQLYRTYYEDYYSPIIDDYGTIHGVSVFVVDITQRKKTEMDLLQNEQKFRALFENVQDVFYQIDLNGIIQEISPSIKEFTEIDRDKIIGTNVSNLYFNPDERVRFLDEIKKKGEVRDFELLFKTKNGETKFASVNARLLFDADGRPNHIDGALRDVTERRKSIHAIRESEQRYHHIFDHTTEGLILLSQDGKLAEVNKSFAEMHGYTVDEMKNLNIEDLDVLREGAFEGRADILRRIHAGEVVRFEVEHYHKDGHIITLSDSVSLITLGDQEYYLAFHQDITERKHFELELIKAKEHAEQSDRLKSAFLANISHEIRTPMNGILGFSDLLKEPGITTEEQQNYIQVIQKSGARLLNIINDVVDIAKIEAGQMEIDISRTNVNEKTAYIVNFFTPEAEKNGIQISCENGLPQTAAIIQSDSDKILAILLNLVNNAMKFTHQGFIHFGYRKTGDFLEFFVKDTGIGISQDQQDLIFERFRQGDKMITKAYEGTGLGLSISKAYVEMLGGKIWLESELGKGATFYFTIPYNADENVKSSVKNVSANTEANHQDKKLKILIAEDDESSVSFLSTALKIYRREILTVGTGIEVVEACRANPDLDLILMDIRMPDLDGYSATRQIRQFNKSVVIIAQTAYAMAGDREKAIGAGCNDHISKPVTVGVLKGVMRKYFGK